MCVADTRVLCPCFSHSVTVFPHTQHDIKTTSRGPSCRPSDIGLNQAGLPECVVQAVSACPAGLAPLLYAQVRGGDGGHRVVQIVWLLCLRFVCRWGLHTPVVGCSWPYTHVAEPKTLLVCNTSSLHCLHHCSRPPSPPLCAFVCPSGRQSWMDVVCCMQVVLTGGCVNTPGFVSRFQTELRALVPSDLELVVTAPVVSRQRGRKEGGRDCLPSSVSST